MRPAVCLGVLVRGYSTAASKYSCKCILSSELVPLSSFSLSLPFLSPATSFFLSPHTLSLSPRLSLIPFSALSTFLSFLSLSHSFFLSLSLSLSRLLSRHLAPFIILFLHPSIPASLAHPSHHSSLCPSISTSFSSFIPLPLHPSSPT